MLVKRILSILVITVLVNCMLAAPSFAEKSTDYEQFGFLAALDIIDVSGQNASNTVTRGNLAYILAKAFCVNSETGINFMNYKDVNMNTPHLGAIDAMSGMRAFTGSDGYFYPDRIARVEEAVKAIVTAMGYDFKARSRGGYPQGYFAALPELTRHINVSCGGELTMGDLAQMLYNVFEIEFPDNYIKEGSIALLNRVYKGTGRITGNAFTGLADAGGVPDGYVEIDGENIMKTGATQAASLLGCIVKYYYQVDRYDGGCTLLSAVPKEGVNKLVIDSSDIENYDNGVYSFLLNAKKKTVKTAQDAFVLYNYSAVKEPFNRYVPVYGRVTLIENSGQYDFVLIEEYRTGIVENVGRRIYRVP